MTQSVELDPQGFLPELDKSVLVSLQTASGSDIGSMNFKAPIIEPIWMLVLDVWATRGQKGLVIRYDNPTDSFTLTGWDPAKRVLTAQLK